MQTIKLNYMDFDRRGYTAQNDFFYRLLQQKYTVEICTNPDYVFYSTGSNHHHEFHGIRIFWTGENVIPNFNYCDYALGFHHLDFGDRYARFPLWRSHEDKIMLGQKRGKDFSDSDLLNRAFCAFVVSNAKLTDGKREEAFEQLSRYKPVASGGRYKNNVGGPVADKLAFQKGYKFALAYENTYSPGYTTEKILDAFASDTIPIYYGDPLVVRDFNPDAFINAHDFDSTENLVEYIRHVDTNDALYLKIIRAPMFRENKMPAGLTHDALMRFFDRIFEQPLTHARRRYFIKPYLDLDYRNIKARDLKGILGAQLMKRLGLKPKRAQFDSQ